MESPNKNKSGQGRKGRKRVDTGGGHHIYHLSYIERVCVYLHIYTYTATRHFAHWSFIMKITLHCVLAREDQEKIVRQSECQLMG